MNVPKLRFKEFDGEWEARNIGGLLEDNIILNQSDGNHGELYPKKSEFQNSGIPYLSASNIKENTLEYSDLKYLSLDRAKKFKKGVANDGDVLLAHNATVGPSVLLKTKYPFVILSTTLTLYRLNKEKMDNLFFSNILRSDNVQFQLKRMMKQTTRNQVPILAQRKINIHYPCNTKEQKKIGEFFGIIDKKIQLQQQKIDLLQEQKKGYMQKIFKREWRFKEFTQQWKTTTIGSLAEISRGASPRPIQDPKWFDENSNVGWLRISDVTKQNGRIHYLEQKISILGQEKTRVLETPHLLLSIAATVGKPVINYIPTGVHDGFLIFYNPTFNVEFMFQWLEMFRDTWRKYGQPGSQVNLNSELVKNQEISIPVIEEQQKIAEFLTLMDKKIQLQKEKLELIQQQKQGFMQQMFI